MNKKKHLIIILFLFFILTIIINNIAIKREKEIIYEENIKIISYIIDKYPDSKSELIDVWLSNEKVDNDYFIEMKKIKEYDSVSSILKLNFIAISILFVFLFFIFEKEKRHTKKEIKKINDYINKIVNNEFEINFKDFKNTDLSILKSDIGKIVMKLKENNENEIKQKKIMKEFMSNISHQIKTPLTSLFLTNDILKNEIENEKNKQFLNEAEKQLDRIKWLIESLLKMSMLESGSAIMQKEDILISELIKEALKPYKNELDLKKIKVNVKCSKIAIKVDKKWTVEAISNIINNAIKHTKNEINIECGEIYFYKFIKITDNGEGITKENQKIIFERFKSFSQNGVGIGLNISKEIIEKQNGTINVSSNNGTTFEVRFY